jgi:hypothetical protein
MHRRKGRHRQFPAFDLTGPGGVVDLPNQEALEGDGEVGSLNPEPS